jgi:iron complex transport system substrate-binding protein
VQTTSLSWPRDIEHRPARSSGPGRLAAPARRIVSLLPSATEIVCSLGLSDRLLAVSHECDFPPEAVAGLPRMTADRIPPATRRSAEIDAAVRAALVAGHGLYALDERLLGRLAPDLVLTQELCHVCAVSYPTVLQAARAAGGAGAPLVVSLEPHSLADVLATIELVATLAGVEARGERVIAALRARLAALEPPTRRPDVALLEWLDPLFAPGHWVPEQIERAGGEPVMGVSGERSRESSWEALAAADPDVVVLGLCGFDLPRTLDEWSAFEPPVPLTRTKAWRNGQMWAIDGSAYVSRPGPRLIDGVEILAAVVAGRPDQRAIRLPRAEVDY